MSAPSRPVRPGGAPAPPPRKRKPNLTPGESPGSGGPSSGRGGGLSPAPGLRPRGGGAGARHSVNPAGRGRGLGSPSQRPPARPRGRGGSLRSKQQVPSPFVAKKLGGGFKKLGGGLKSAAGGGKSAARMVTSIRFPKAGNKQKKPPVPPKPSMPLTILTAESLAATSTEEEAAEEEGVTFSSLPERPPRKKPSLPGPTRSQGSVRGGGAVRESRLMSVAKSFICIDPQAFMSQMKKEEDLESVYDQTRQLPLPEPPCMSKTATEVPVVRGRRESVAIAPLAPLAADVLETLQAAEKDMQKNYRRRTKAKRSPSGSDAAGGALLEKLLQSEKEYLCQLNVIVELFLMPIRTRGLLNKFEIVSLFSNVESILSLGMNLMKEFTSSAPVKKITAWIGSAKVKEGVGVADVADAFARYAEVLLAKYRNYCSNLPNISARITQFSMDNDGFRLLLSSASSDPRAAEGLEALLRLPLLRLRQYCELLEELGEAASKELPGGTEISLWGDGNRGVELLPSPEGSSWAGVSVGAFHAAAVTDGGKVWVWGRGTAGQLGLGRQSLGTHQPELVTGPLSEAAVTRVVAGPLCTAAITGALWMWGLMPAAGPAFEPIANPYAALKGKKIIDVAFSPSVAVFVVAAGAGTEVWSAGMCKSGELGHGKESQSIEDPACIEPLTQEHVTSVQAGDQHFAALTKDGRVFVWGSNKDESLGVGKVDTSLPQLVSALPAPVSEVSCGRAASFAVTEGGDLLAWGLGSRGVLGLGEGEDLLVSPASVSEVCGVKFSSVAVGGDHVVGLTDDGTVVAWGDGAQFKTGHEEEDDIFSPDPLPSLAGASVRALAAGSSCSLALVASPSPYHRVQAATAVMEQMLAVVQQSVDQVENVTQLIGLEATIENADDYNIRDTSRAFVLDGILQRDGKDCYVVVLSDVILLCQVVTRPQPPQLDGLFSVTDKVKLDGCLVTEYDEEEKAMSFALGAAGDPEIAFTCESAEEKEKWVATVTAAQERYCGDESDGPANPLAASLPSAGTPSGSPSASPAPPRRVQGGPPSSLPSAPGGPPSSLPSAPGGPPSSLPAAPGGPPTSLPAAPGGPPSSLPSAPTSASGPPKGLPLVPGRDTSAIAKTTPSAPASADGQIKAAPATLVRKGSVDGSRLVPPPVASRLSRTSSGTNMPRSSSAESFDRQGKLVPPPVAPRASRNISAPPTAPRQREAPREQSNLRETDDSSSKEKPSVVAAREMFPAKPADDPADSAPPSDAPPVPGIGLTAPEASQPTAPDQPGSNLGGGGQRGAGKKKGHVFSKTVSKKVLGKKATGKKALDLSTVPAEAMESEVIKILMAQVEAEKKARIEAEAKVALLEGRLAKGKAKGPNTDGVTNELCSHINKLTKLVEDLETEKEVLKLEVKVLRTQLKDGTGHQPPA